MLPVDVDVLSVQPHAHNLAREVNGYAALPDGTTRWLIKIREWDFKWQDVYRYREPVALPSGTTLVMQYSYDNSADNALNPNNPPRRVTFGQTTSSEMGDLWLQVATRSAGDRAALDRDYAPKMLREDIAGAEKVLELNPADARLHTDLAFCYLDAGRLSEAVAHLEESVRLEPGSANAHYDLGTALLRERKLDDAGEHFARAVRLQPTLSEAHNNLGVVHFLKGRIDDAIASYTDALRLKADNAEAHYNLGRAFAAAQRSGEAIDQYQRALALQPDDAVTHSSLAGQLAGSGQLEQAIVHYRRALQLVPDLPAALVDLAWILATSERPEIRAPDEAVRLAERVAGLTIYQNATVLDTLAVAYYSAGRRDRAISIEQTALDLATTDGPRSWRHEFVNGWSSTDGSDD